MAALPGQVGRAYQVLDEEEFKGAASKQPGSQSKSPKRAFEGLDDPKLQLDARGAEILEENPDAGSKTPDSPSKTPKSDKSPKSFDSSPSVTRTISASHPGARKYLVMVNCVVVVAFALFVWLCICYLTDWSGRVERGAKMRLIGSSVRPATKETESSAAVMALSIWAQAEVALLGLAGFLVTMARSVNASQLQKLSGFYFVALAFFNVSVSIFFNFLPAPSVQLASGTLNTCGTMVQMLVLRTRCKGMTDGVSELAYLIKYMKHAQTAFFVELVITLLTVIIVDVLDKSRAIKTDDDVNGNPEKLMWAQDAGGMKGGAVYLGFFVFTPCFFIWSVFWAAGYRILQKAMNVLNPSDAIRSLMTSADLDAITESYSSARCEYLAIVFAIATWLVAFPAYVLTALNSATSTTPHDHILTDGQIAACTFLMCVDTMSNDLLTMYMGGLGRSAEKARDAFLSSIRVALKSQTLAAAKVEMERSALAKDMIPWLEGFEFNVVDVQKFLAAPGPMPKHQDLWNLDGWISTKRVDIRDVMDGSVMLDTAAVSYSWATPEHPDPDGLQAEAVRQFLVENPHIKNLWMDWASLPQKPRSEEDGKKFGAGLKNSNMMYLGASVVIILTPEYLSRFWTQLEAFLSFQQIDNHKGINPHGAPYPRTHCVFTSDVPEEMREAIKEELHRKWSECSVFVALSLLAEPSTKVTNGSDKIKQISKMMEMQETAKVSASAVEIEILDEDLS